MSFDEFQQSCVLGSYCEKNCHFLTNLVINFGSNCQNDCYTLTNLDISVGSIIKKNQDICL